MFTKPPRRHAGRVGPGFDHFASMEATNQNSQFIYGTWSDRLVFGKISAHRVLHDFPQGNLSLIDLHHPSVVLTQIVTRANLVQKAVDLHQRDRLASPDHAPDHDHGVQRERFQCLLAPCQFWRHQPGIRDHLPGVASERLGQLFLAEGLDRLSLGIALSFNYSHPHYLYIQRWLHKALRLFVNRQKAIAKGDLDQEKAKGLEALTSARVQTAFDIWSSRQGEDADPPIQRSNLIIPVTEVGTTSIEWPVGQSKENVDIAGSLAIILEAYGVLSSLSLRDRARMINDIIKLFEVK